MESTPCLPATNKALELECNDLRQEIKRLESVARSLMRHSDVLGAPDCFPGQRGEMKANIMLTVRHLEDARMRVGKVLQYADDGVSILDKIAFDKTVPVAE